MNKLLLWLTGIILVAFVFTFPTRDRRGTLDSIRMKVGATNAVSKTTLKELASQKGRKLASAGNPMERQEKLNRSVTYYCNESFNRQACGHWLNHCGEMCRMLVSPSTWNTMTRKTQKAPPQTVASHKARARRSTR
jgi:hypothetical protein